MSTLFAYRAVAAALPAPLGEAAPPSGPGARRPRRASRPISRVLSWATIHLGRPSPDASSGLPESGADHAEGLLFGLAPGGVCLAADVAVERGALLPHPFTLTAAAAFAAAAEAVCSLLHFPWARAPQALPGALSCGARTFLCAGWRSGCLAGSLRHHSTPLNRALIQRLARGTGEPRGQTRRLRRRQLLQQHV